MFATLLLACAADPVPLTTRIEDVTVYTETALVHRSARIERGGSYVVRGLPAALDPRAVRVRCPAGDVVRVEVRERRASGVPEARVQGLRERLDGERRELQRLQDEKGVFTTLQGGLVQLAQLDARDHARDVAAGSGDPAAWRASAQFLSERSAEVLENLRENSWKIDDRTRAIQALERELGGLQSDGNVLVHDVEVEVAANGPSTLDVEYLVHATGWTPAYDLRAASSLAAVELVYRARVHQNTGEDWNDVALALSTAQPQRGAQGPEPVTAWVSVNDPRVLSGSSSRGLTAQREAPKALSANGYDGGDQDAARDRSPYAEVERLGLSARFQLARRETIPSRDEPVSVLVGEAQLAINPERFCTPALDTTVWLRAKAVNTSPWILLPGDAAVFLGADYLGRARIELVQTGQELTLHLGADPMLTVTRTKIEDLSKGPAFLSSRASKVDAWRVRIENHGAVVANGSGAPNAGGAVASNAGGAVDVFVREAVARTRDNRIEIELTKAEPRESNDARWKQDREERGIHTWVLRVPRGGATELVLQTTITYPKDAVLARD